MDGLELRTRRELLKERRVLPECPLHLRQVEDNVHEEHGKQETDPDPRGKAQDAGGMSG